jgi:hypothetical protein
MNPTIISSARFLTIEETAILQGDAPLQDFACHFYNTRYDRLKGIPKENYGGIRDSVVPLIRASFQKNEVAMRQYRDEGKNPMSWSMNWYRLRLNDRRWAMSPLELAQLHEEFAKIVDQHPSLDTELYAIQSNNSDMLLIAVPHRLRHD